MAARRTAPPGQPRTQQAKREEALSPCPMNPECAAEFAAIATNYQNLRELLDRLERNLGDGIESIRNYLKVEYAQAIEYRFEGLTKRISTTEEQLGSLQKRVNQLYKIFFFTSGGLAVLTFLINLAAGLLPKLLGGK